MVRTWSKLKRFASRYESKLIPAVKAAFESLLAKFQRKGIDWSDVHYAGSEITAQPTGKFSSVPLTILFTHKGIEHRIIMHSALVIDGKWKASQYLKLA